MAGTVIVACRIINGVELNLDRYQPVGDKGMVRYEKGKIGPVVLNGPKLPHQQNTPADLPYVLNQVDADFWAEWEKRNVDSSLLADRLLVSSSNAANAKAQAKENDDAAPLNGPLTETDPRVRSLGVKKFNPDDVAA